MDGLPDLLDYFGFVFHFPGLLGGPNTFYREYQDVMNNIRYKPGQVPNSRWIPALINFLKGVVYLIVYVISSVKLPTDVLYEDSFHEKSLLLRILIIYITFLGVRCRYYGLWKLGEGICICNGFGEQEDADGNKNWNGISNVDIIPFETCSSFSQATHIWNKRTQKWLQMCIYERSNFNQFYVFMVSAFWHGFYPSYYMGFIYGSCLQALNKICTKKLWPRVQGTKFERIYLILGNMCVFVFGSFMLEGMFSYTVERALLCWKQASYYGLVVLPFAYIILTLIPAVKTEKKE